MKNFYSYIDSELISLKERGLYRNYTEILDSEKGLPYVNIDGRDCLLFSTCDYLGLTHHPKMIEASTLTSLNSGVGTGATRFIGGTRKLHNLVEAGTATFHKKESSVFYNTGYMANLGAISCLANKNDIIFSDQLNHASIIDGIKLSRAQKEIWEHNNIDDLRRKVSSYKGNGNKIIICEALYSMDGDFAPLYEIVKISEEYDCLLYVDEIHSVAVYGESGRGYCDELGIADQVDILMGGFSKGFGSLGGYIASSKSICDYLKSKSNGFIFSVSMPEMVLSSILTSLSITEEVCLLQKKVRGNSIYFKKELQKNGFDVNSNSHIFPIMIGEEHKTKLVSQKLLNDHNIYAQGIVFPTVALNSGRLRISISAFHCKESIDLLIKALCELKSYFQ